jgi:hypothetical protein
LLRKNGRRAARKFLDEFELESYMNTYHARPASLPAAAETH